MRSIIQTLIIVLAVCAGGSATSVLFSTPFVVNNLASVTTDFQRASLQGGVFIVPYISLAQLNMGHYILINATTDSITAITNGTMFWPSEQYAYSTIVVSGGIVVSSITFNSSIPQTVFYNKICSYTTLDRCTSTSSGTNISISASPVLAMTDIGSTNFGSVALGQAANGQFVTEFLTGNSSSLAEGYTTVQEYQPSWSLSNSLLALGSNNVAAICVTYSGIVCSPFDPIKGHPNSFFPIESSSSCASASLLQIRLELVSGHSIVHVLYVCNSSALKYASWDADSASLLAAAVLDSAYSAPTSLVYNPWMAFSLSGAYCIWDAADSSVKLASLPSSPNGAINVSTICSNCLGSSLDVDSAGNILISYYVADVSSGMSLLFVNLTCDGRSGGASTSMVTGPGSTKTFIGSICSTGVLVATQSGAFKTTVSLVVLNSATKAALNFVTWLLVILAGCLLTT